MPITNVTATLRTLLRQLEAERGHLDHQIAAIRDALDGATRPGSVGRIRRGTKPARPRMSAAARRAVSQRMKTYWAKRKGQRAKGKGKPKAKQ
jgi:hypothetical protein